MTAGRAAGRRAGGSGTRAAILAAARHRFADHGYDGATIRSIAAEAGVDPALVHHFFGPKEQLFVAAMRLPIEPSEILAILERGSRNTGAGPDAGPGRDAGAGQDAGASTGELLIRTGLKAWDDPGVRATFLGLLRSALTSEQAAAMLREFVAEAILRPVARVVSANGGAGDLADAEYRAGMVASQVLGLAVTRFVLALGPVAAASQDDLAATIGPTLQRYLTGEIRPAATRPARRGPAGTDRDLRRVGGGGRGGTEPYLHGHHDSVLRSHRWRTAENSAGYLLPKLSPGARVLDIGCGPGTITAGLAARVGDGSVVGIDVAGEVLADARAGAVRQGRRNVSFQVGDVYQLAFADGAFDVVHAHQVLQHLADPVAALAEMRRAGRPGGVVAARDADYGGMFWFPEDPGLKEWQLLYQRVARALGGEPDAGRRLLGWARAAGFADVEVSASSWCYATPGERSWWGGLWAERVTQSNFADQAVRLGLASREDLGRLAAAWHRWAASDDGWFLIPHGEILCRG